MGGETTMKNLKFVWDQTLKEWQSEKPDGKKGVYYMDQNATQFFKFKGTARVDVATSYKSTQTDQSVPLAKEEENDWQLHYGDSRDKRDTERVTIEADTSVRVPPSPGIIPAGLQLEGNSFVFTRWVDPKNPTERTMKGLKFTWDKDTDEWKSEKTDGTKADYYMDRNATQFFKFKGANARIDVATSYKFC